MYVVVPSNGFCVRSFPTAASLLWCSESNDNPSCTWQWLCKLFRWLRQCEYHHLLLISLSCSCSIDSLVSYSLGLSTDGLEDMAEEALESAELSSKSQILVGFPWTIALPFTLIMLLVPVLFVVAKRLVLYFRAPTADNIDHKDSFNHNRTSELQMVRPSSLHSQNLLSSTAILSSSRLLSHPSVSLMCINNWCSTLFSFCCLFDLWPLLIPLPPSELIRNWKRLIYATHFNTMYLTWDKLDNLRGILEHTLQQSEAFDEEDWQKKEDSQR